MSVCAYVLKPYTIVHRQSALRNKELTVYEIVVLFISILAVSISLASLNWTRKIGLKQLELDQQNANLAEKQLKILKNEEQNALVAKIDVELAGHSGDYKFIISNVGGADAKEVHFSVDGNGYPLVAREYAEKIPITVLRPGKCVELVATRSMGCGSQYETQVLWYNPDGTQGRDKIMAHW